MTNSQRQYLHALNRLAKWRTVLAGWQLGTRAKGDPESDAVRDHREATLILRVEVTALVALLVEANVFTSEQYQRQVAIEATHLNDALAQKFPGVTTTDDGLSIDPRVALNWMKAWKP